MWLKNHWYAVLDSNELKQRPVKAERLGELLVFWRDSQGKAHVQQDRCPHLGASLSQGHISRAIENQLDSAHLPFVHHNTIGRRLSPFIQGPYVEADATGIHVWNFQHLDADKQLSQQELKGHIKGRSPSLVLLFPGIWRLKISEGFYQFIAFVPVNATTTHYYLRHYRNWKVPLVDALVSKAMSLSNRIILNQDKRVVCAQLPINSAEAEHEHLIGADRAIAQFRRWVRQLQG